MNLWTICGPQLQWRLEFLPDRSEAESAANLAGKPVMMPPPGLDFQENGGPTATAPTSSAGAERS